MKIGINLATLDWRNQFENLPRISEEIGAEGIEFPIQLWLKHGAPLNQLNFLPVFNVCNLLHQTEIFPESLFTSSKRFEEQLHTFDRKLQAVRALSCPFVSVGIDPWVDLSLSEAEKIFEERVQLLVSKLSAYNIELLLEYISPRIGEKKNQLFCPSLQKALEWIKKLKGKLLLDIMHWYTEGMSIEPRDFVNQIGLVHFCDALSLGSLSDLDRRLPYKGQFPLNRFIASLVEGGYKGPATIEVFRTDEYQPSLSQIKTSLNQIKARIKECKLTLKSKSLPVHLL